MKWLENIFAYGLIACGALPEVHVKRLKDVVRRVNGSRCDQMFRLTATKSKSKTKLCHRSSCKPGIKKWKGFA